MGLLRADIGRLSFEDFEARPIDERLLILPLLSPKKRFEFLTDSRDARRLVRSMPVVDLAVTIKEIGIDGSGALLALCDYEQMQYIMDLDTWEGFHFSKNRMHHYLMVLREWDAEELLDKFVHLDYEQQLLYLLGDFRIFLAKEDFDPQEGTLDDTFTIEGTYYIKPLCDEEKCFLVKEILTEIFAKDYNLYRRLVEGMRQEIYVNLEEDFYRIRSSRITELGFYEYQEAIGVYSEPTGIRREIVPPEIDNLTYARLPVKYISDIEAMDGVGENIDRREMLEILFELQVLINRLIIADRLEMFEIESIEESSEKVRALLRLGLEVMKSESGIEPIDALKGYYVIDIFRNGYKKLRSLRNEAKRILSLNQYLKYVDMPPYFENLIKIAYTNFGEIDMTRIFSDAKYTYPASLKEIARLFDLLYELESSLEILIRCYNVTVSDIEEIKRFDTNIPKEESPSLFSLLITPFANHLLGKAPLLLPLARGDIERLARLSFVRSGDDLLLSEEFLKKMEETVFSPLKKGHLYTYARRIVGRALEEYIAELGNIQNFSEIKTDYISCLIIRNDFS